MVLLLQELQRQKLEYESKKKVAEQLRRQQEEEDEREQRRRAAQRLQEEQQAMLEKQREDTRIQEEQARAWEEARKREVTCICYPKVFYRLFYCFRHVPRCEKTILWGFGPGLTQTDLCSYRRWLEARNFEFRKKNCTILIAKTKVLLSSAETALLICTIVFT